MEDSRKVMLAALQFACLDSVSENVDTAGRLVMGGHKKGANIILIQVIEKSFISIQQFAGINGFRRPLELWFLQGAAVVLYPGAIGLEPQDEGLNSCDG
ncbi:putative N-carbamoylputrescine amidase [Dioscorea sansibarensis]